MDSTFVEILRNLTVETIDMVKASSPLVWEMTKQRVMIIATTGIRLGGVGIVISFFLFALGIYAFKKDVDDISVWFFVFGFTLLVISTIVCCSNWVSLHSVDYLTTLRILEMIKP